MKTFICEFQLCCSGRHKLNRLDNDTESWQKAERAESLARYDKSISGVELMLAETRSNKANDSADDLSALAQARKKHEDAIAAWKQAEDAATFANDCKCADELIVAYAKKELQLALLQTLLQQLQTH